MQLSISEIEFKYQWQVNHGPEQKVEFSLPYEFRNSIFRIPGSERLDM